MTRLYRFALALLICWTAWCCVNTAGKAYLAGEFIKAGMTFSKVKK